MWNEKQVRKFLEVARRYALYPVLLFAVGTGLRLGEILSLTWEDLDLNRAIVSVMRKRKTRHSTRQVELPAQVCDTLRAIGRKSGRIFPYNRSYVYHKFLLIAEKGKLPRIRFHDLRHTHATNLLSRGINPKVVQERLGHHSAAFTLDVYSHVLPGMQQGAVRVIERVLH